MLSFARSLVLVVTIYTDTTTYLLSSILIAPFLLLKTPRSIALSHKMFLYKQNIDEEHPFRSWGLLIAIVLFMITIHLIDFLSNYWHLGNGGWRDFIYGILIGIILIGCIGVIGSLSGLRSVSGLSAISVDIFFLIILFGVLVGSVGFNLIFVGVIVGIAGAVNAVDDIVGIVGAGVIVGYLIRSLIIKFVVTSYTFFVDFFTNPIKLLENIAQNYREQLWVNDSYYAPELLPDISKVDESFSLSGHLTWSESIFENMFRIFIIPVLSLAYFYRWSIKSTGWFYFPLAFLANTIQKIKDDDMVKRVIDIQTNSRPLAKLKKVV